MRKSIILALFAVPCFTMAQSEWVVPDAQKPENTKQVVAKKSIDEKYAAGTVPVVDGNVVFEKTIKVPGVSADELYDRVLNAITDITKDDKQLDNSRIGVVNKHDHVIAASLKEDMVFSKGALARDFTEIKYTLIATCHDGSVDLQFMRISYLYDKGRQTEISYKAEELITDKEAINKKGTKFYRPNGKFRKKTIDRKDEVFTFIESKIK